MLQRWSRVLLIGVAIAFSSAPLFALDPPETPKPWVFFDLGDTLVRTPSDPQTHDLVRIHWMRFIGEDGKETDAHAYLLKLAALGYPIGMITNIPQEWGDADLSKGKAWRSEGDLLKKSQLALALTEIKSKVIADFFEGHGPGDPANHPRRWSDSEYPTMDWSLFPVSQMLVPFFTEYRKPDHGPPTSDTQLFLYSEAVRMASRANARAVYQGENKFEVAAAQQARMFGHLATFSPDAPVQVKGFLLSPAEIDRLVSEK